MTAQQVACTAGPEMLPSPSGHSSSFCVALETEECGGDHLAQVHSLPDCSGYRAP